MLTCTQRPSGENKVHILLSINMTASKKPNNKTTEAFMSSRQWAEDCLVTIKKMQDEYLDRYHTDVEGNSNMLKLLNQLVEQLERRL